MKENEKKENKSEEKKSPDPKSEVKKTTGTIVINERKDLRYFIKQHPVGRIGSIVEAGRGGARIEKLGKKEIDEKHLDVIINFNKRGAAVVWQDEKNIGLKFDEPINNFLFFKSNTLCILSISFHPINKQPLDLPEKISLFENVVYILFINLFSELEKSDVDIYKVEALINDITGKCADISPEKGQVMVKITSPDDNGRDRHKPFNLKDFLLTKANSAEAAAKVKIIDAGTAIRRLGRDKARAIAGAFYNETVAAMDIRIKEFDNFHAFNVFKLVTIKQFMIYFNLQGYHDKKGAGILLFCYETAGLPSMLEKYAVLRKYYTGPMNLYSELTRMYETLYMGKDMLTIDNEIFKGLRDLDLSLADGYFLAHMNLNPHYNLPSDIEITLEKNALIYSYMVFLVFLAARYIMDRDVESGAILFKRLQKRTGMKSGKAVTFINSLARYVQGILKRMGVNDIVNPVAFPTFSYNIDELMPTTELHCSFFLDTIKSLQSSNIKRLAIRYEDEQYTHFTLNKLLDSPTIGLDKLSYCIIPCGNVAKKVFSIEDVAFFDILVFKNIDRLPPSLAGDFVKIWEDFEGRIIVTFSVLKFLDFENEALYKFLRKNIIDFPSYITNSELYENMIDHAVNSVIPLVEKIAFRQNEQFLSIARAKKADFIKGFYSMDYIKTDLLQRFIMMIDEEEIQSEIESSEAEIEEGSETKDSLEQEQSKMQRNRFSM